MNLQSFSARFSFEDLAALCARPDFLAAVEASDFALAEVLAAQFFAARDASSIDIAVAQQLNWDSRHAEAKALVAQWAAATGHTGGDHKQARQSRIRRIVKHGINSDYARAIRAEAGMISE